MTKLKDILYISTSEINDFTTCQHRFFLKHLNAPGLIDKNEDDYVDILPQEYLTVGKYRHKVLELYVSGKIKNIKSIAKQQLVKYGISMDRYMQSDKLFEVWTKRPYLKYKVLKTEHPFHVILGSGVALRGRIDLLLEINKNTILINDYKTGDFPIYQKYLDSSLQMKNYALAVKKLYPQYKNVICQIDALKYDVFEKKVTDKWLEGVEDYLEAIYSAILSKSKTKISDYPPSFSENCYRCEFQKICPLIKNLDKLRVNPLRDLSGKTLKHLAEEYLKNYTLCKRTENNYTMIKSILVKMFEDMGTNEVEEKWGSISYKGNRLAVKLK